jgi:ribose/xylose/arabinose/galactoside ABC-type transport system permease subunit
MAYDEPTFRRPEGADGSPIRGEGFREESEFRPGTGFSSGSYPMSDYPTDADGTTMSLGRRTTSGGAHSTALDDVFDDPDHGEPGRDRLAVHAGWELVLLVGVGALGYLVWRAQPDALRGDALKSLLVMIATFGFIALGAGLSLRAAAPNLAVGPVAMAAAVFYAENGDKGVVATAGVVALAAFVLGVGLAILVVGFHVPGWAASLAGAFVAIVWLQKQGSPIPIAGGYQPLRHAYLLAGGFAAVAILGGLIGSVKAVRRSVGRFRPIADPARRRGGVAAGLTAASLIVSTMLPAVGGVLIASSETDRQITPTLGLELTGLALGAVLIGGTSAYGRRGGIFGTVFAVTLLVLFIQYDAVKNWRISPFALAAGMIVAGLIVTRLVETLGRPRSARDDDDEGSDEVWTTTGTPPNPTGWTPPRNDSWSSSLPAQPSAGRTADLWSDDRWGSRSGS